MTRAVLLTPPAERQRPALSPDDARAGLRAVLQIFDRWQVNTEGAMVLLGSPPRSTFFAWKAGKGTTFALDLMTRISYILGIFKALEILYQNPTHADRWINQPNLAFGDQSALQRMLGGQITDLAAVRDYLDRVRGGW
jgi:Protein of unknown function (DUF2384)